MTEPQVWVLLALFAGVLATVSGLVVHVVRSEIAGLRGEMIARIETVETRFEAVDARMDARFEALESRMNARFDHLDRDVAALSKRVFDADQP